MARRFIQRALDVPGQHRQRIDEFREIFDFRRTGFADVCWSDLNDARGQIVHRQAQMRLRSGGLLVRACNNARRLVVRDLVKRGGDRIYRRLNFARTIVRISRGRFSRAAVIRRSTSRLMRAARVIAASRIARRCSDAPSATA